MDDSFVFANPWGLRGRHHVRIAFDIGGFVCCEEESVVWRRNDIVLDRDFDVLLVCSSTMMRLENGRDRNSVSM